MKKVKLVFIAIALVAGIGGAFASRPDVAAPCEGMQQYYWTGTQYLPVQGAYGVGWYCEFTSGSTCTYWRPNPGQPNFYVGCMSGVYRTVF